jgi:hypothetical protein
MDKVEKLAYEIEALVDRNSMARVLDLLAIMAAGKAEHIEQLGRPQSCESMDSACAKSCERLRVRGAREPIELERNNCAKALS